MPRPRSLLLALALASGVASACTRGEPTTTPTAPARRPRLAVVLVVDQMRADYLDRFADLYRGGFARLRSEGAWFTEGHVQHALTYTAPGHASVATGSHPARHGIIANDWFDRAAGDDLYAVEDPQTRTAPGDLPGRSPRQLLRLALGDWLKAQEPGARVLSLALKDRSAVLMGGQRPDRAYWYSAEQAGFVSSSWYADGAPLPKWVVDFNASGAALASFAGGWARLGDPTDYVRSGPDRVEAEGDGVHTELPHVFDDGSEAARAGYPKQLLTTPFGDQLALQFARLAIAQEQLGADEVPDLLMISCSSADYIGHAYGPDSHEVEDYYLRLDGWLGELLTYLDEHVGKDSYVLALTADHGALPLPEEAALRGHPSARRIGIEVYRAQVSAAVVGAAKQLGLGKDVLLHVGDDGVWLAGTRAGAVGVTPAQLHAGVAAALRKLDFVADAFTAEELAGPADAARPYLTAYQRSYFAARSPDVQLRFKEWYLVDERTHGTSHGSPYPYDTHVPVLFFGAGVRSGRHNLPAGTVDVAPTLAELLGVTTPGDLDGRSLAGRIR